MTNTEITLSVIIYFSLAIFIGKMQWEGIPDIRKRLYPPPIIIGMIWPILVSARIIRTLFFDSWYRD